MNLGTILLSPVPTPTAVPAVTPAFAGGAGAAQPTAVHSSLQTSLAGLSVGSQVQGTVTGRNGEGKLVLRTARGLFTMPGETALPVGSRVVIDVRRVGKRVEATLTQVQRPPLTGPDGSAQPWLQGRWPNLSALMQEVENFSALSRLPDTGQPLAARILWFMAAIQGGGLAHMLGRDLLARAGEQASHSLLDGLAKDLDVMRSASREALPWRAYFVPLLDEGALRQLAFFIRRRSDEETAPGNAKDETRFIVEAELSTLGALQIDGVAGAGSLNLALRTKTPLPADWQTDLLSLYEDVTSAGGLRGRLQFNVAARFPVSPREENHAASQSTDLFV